MHLRVRKRCKIICRGVCYYCTSGEEQNIMPQAWQAIGQMTEAKGGRAVPVSPSKKKVN